MVKILVVEDDVRLNRLVCRLLSDYGYQPIGCGSAAEAFEAMEHEPFDMIITDVMMPGMDGFEFADAVRQQDREVPILFMTALDDMASKRKGFRIGIDDYMVKPVDMNEMLLRVSALLRRAQAISSRQLAVGGTVLVYDDLAVRWNGRAAVLPRKEFQLLYKLLSSPGKTFTRRQLMDEIWDLDTDSDEHTVNVHINRLRDRFRDNRDFAIVTVRGLGYKAVRL